jgi:hypothetical protein
VICYCLDQGPVPHLHGHIQQAVYG